MSGDGASALTNPQRRSERVRAAAQRWYVEIGIVVATFALYSWRLDRNGYGNPFYAASARSMTVSWRNYVFGAFDPGGWDTVDKPPLGQWIGAASVKVFGFSTWSLLVPSALAGALTVLLTMAIVRRSWGRGAGLIAGVALMVTPMMLAVSRSNNPDVFLVLAAVASAWAALRGIEDGRPRWMMLAGAFGALGFLAKSLAIGSVLPGIWLAYLIAGQGTRFRKRIVHCFVGALAFAAVAGGWMAGVDSISLTSRPWVGGSKDGTAADLAFGYNGLGRLTGKGDGQMANMGRGSAMFAGPGGIDEFGGKPELGRLFNRGMGDQWMWLAPIAAGAAVGGLALALRKRKRDARLGQLIMWTTWIVVSYRLLTYAQGTFHNYYVAILCPAVAALVGIGIRLILESRKVGVLVAAIAVALTVEMQRTLLERVPAWQSMRWIVPVGAAVAVFIVAMAVWKVRSTRLAMLSLSVLPAVLLIAPAIWSGAGTRHAQEGTFPDSRPDVGGASSPMLAMLGTREIPEAEMKWLRAQRHGERWVVAVSSANDAEQNVINGDAVAALGGFIGSDKSNSALRIAGAVERGELRYVIAGGFQLGSAEGTSAVVGACAAIAPSAWGAVSGGSTLYDCRGKANALRAFKPRSALKPTGTAGPRPGIPSPGPGIPGLPPGLPPGIKLPPGFKAPPGGFTPELLAWGQCLTQHGGDPFSLANGKPPAGATAAAMNACVSKLPPGGLPKI